MATKAKKPVRTSKTASKRVQKTSKARTKTKLASLSKSKKAKRASKAKTKRTVKKTSVSRKVDKSPGAKKSTTRKRKTTHRKYGKASEQEVKNEMHRYKRGTAKSGIKGRPVKSREQAIAIALSKARKKGARVPQKKNKFLWDTVWDLIKKYSKD